MLLQVELSCFVMSICTLQLPIFPASVPTFQKQNWFLCFLVHVASFSLFSVAVSLAVPHISALLYTTTPLLLAIHLGYLSPYSLEQNDTDLRVEIWNICATSLAHGAERMRG